MSRFGTTLDKISDLVLIDEIEQRGYEVNDTSPERDFVILYQEYISGKDVTQKLINIMIERANYIV